MALARAQRRYQEIHHDEPWHNGMFTSWSAKRSKDHPYHFADGVRLWVSQDDLTPDDDFLTHPRDLPEGHGDAQPDD